VVLSLAVGTAVTALASVLPALTASRIPPVGALGVDAVGEVEGAAPARRSSGLWLMVAGLPVASVGLFVGQGDRVEIWLVGGGMLLTLAGLGRLSPLLVPPMISLLGWPLPRVAGLAGSLGRQNATRNARRTVVTASALLIGVTLVSLLAIIETSARASSDRALGQAITANYQVSQAGSPPLTDGPSHATALSPLVLTRLDARPDLATSPFRFVSFLLDGRANFAGAVDPATITRMISFGHVQGSLAALAQGGLAASVQQASAMDLHVGEVVRVTLFNQLGHGASTDLRVDAIYQRGDIALSGYLFSTATATRIDPSLALNAVFVRARAGVPERVVAHQVGRAVAGFSDVTVRDVAQLQAAVDQSIASEINLISVLLVLAVAVAVLGIVNALALSVVERTRELALLRAVGMSRAQIRSMVRSEAALIGTVGALLGVLLGLFLGWAFQRALRTQGVTELVVPWLRLVVYVAAGAVTGVIAGTLPARRAAQVDMLAAIASE
jgi:putative ABC transport system permease protein